MNDSQTEYEDRGDYLYARLHGPFDAQANVALFGAALEEARKLGKRRVMLDARSQTGAMSFLSRFFLGAELGDFWDRSVRIAVIARPDQVDPQRIAELVAVNRGVPGRLFIDAGEAAKWLMAGSSEEAGEERRENV